MKITLIKIYIMHALESDSQMMGQESYLKDLGFPHGMITIWYD